MTAIEPRRNFPLVQALRGLAASWVVLFHIGKGQYVTGVTVHLPASVRYAVFDYGSAGVAVFFVLSGFVISHSLAGRAIDARGYVRFVARRSLRLDPPYWASIVLTVSVGAVYARARGMPFGPPAATTVLGHVAYLQEFLWLPEIELNCPCLPLAWGPGFTPPPHRMIYWTLAYEIQFYLVLAAGWWAIGALVRRGVGERTAQAAIMVPLGALAFVSAALAREWALHGLFANLWHGFFLGVLAYEAGVRRRALPALLALCAVTLFGAMRADAVFGTPCAVTALVLLVAARTGYLERGMAGRGWQFLGRISYSLYLVHVPTLALGFAIWGRVAGRGALPDLAGLVLVVGGIVVAATAFWWTIERPSHALSIRLFRRGGEPVTASRV